MDIKAEQGGETETQNMEGVLRKRLLSKLQEIQDTEKQNDVNVVPLDMLLRRHVSLSLDIFYHLAAIILQVMRTNMLKNRNFKRLYLGRECMRKLLFFSGGHSSCGKTFPSKPFSKTGYRFPRAQFSCCNVLQIN